MQKSWLLARIFTAGARSLIQLAGGDGLFDLADGLGDLDFARAGFGAVEDGMAAVDAKLVVQDLQALGASPVAAVEDEAVGSDDGCRADILLVRPEGRAGSGAAGAQDALGGVVKALALFDGFAGALAWAPARR